MCRRSDQCLHPSEFAHGQKALVRVRASVDQRAGLFQEVASGLAVLAGEVGGQLKFHGRLREGWGARRPPRFSFLGGEVGFQVVSDGLVRFFLGVHQASPLLMRPM